MASTRKPSLVSKAGAAVRSVVGRAVGVGEDDADVHAGGSQEIPTPPAKKAPAKKTPAGATTTPSAGKSKPGTSPAKTSTSTTPRPATTSPAAAKATEKATTSTPVSTHDPAQQTPAKKPAAKTPASKTPSESSAAALSAAQLAPQLVVLEHEDPWTTDELEQVRSQLADDVARLTGELREVEGDLAGMIENPGDGAGHDQADVGSASFERDQERQIVNNARDMLEQSQHALERIDDGSYGQCEIGGEPIGKNRLMAFPRATLCLRCKQREERR